MAGGTRGRTRTRSVHKAHLLDVHALTCVGGVEGCVQEHSPTFSGNSAPNWDRLGARLNVSKPGGAGRKLRRSARRPLSVAPPSLLP
jgi:hypothetical protein